MAEQQLVMLERAANQLLAVVAPGASRLVYTQVVLDNDASTACTDGASTITMPTSFCGREIPANEELSVGLLAHELSHFLQPLRAVQEVANAEGAPAWLVNILLDIEGEALVESLFPALAAPLTNVRAAVKHAKLPGYRKLLAAATSFTEAAGALALIGRFTKSDAPFSSNDAQDALSPALAGAGMRYLQLLEAALELAPAELPEHLRTLMRACPDLRQAKAPDSPLGTPRSAHNGALGGLLAGEICATLKGWSHSPAAPLQVRRYTREPPRHEAARLTRLIRTRFTVRGGGFEIVAPGRIDRREAARGNLPFRMAVHGRERPLPCVVLCVDVSSSMEDRRKFESAFIAAQALALAVEASGGEVVGLLFDSCAGISHATDAAPLFAPRSQWRMVDGTSFLFLTTAWRRWPRHRFLLITDGQGSAPFALPADRERTAAIVIPPGHSLALQSICGHIVQLDQVEMLPSLLALLLPRSELA